MVKVTVFLVCLSVLVPVVSLIAGYELYALERAMARGVFVDVFDDMQDIGYLDERLAAYYREKMREMGWEAAEGDFFQGTHPMEEAVRARKERGEQVHLSLAIRPSRLSSWLHWLIQGDTAFRFAGQRPSEYFDPRW